LRGIELEGSLDYIATGLPHAGDEMPIGGERFVDDQSPWSFSFVFVIPVIAPRRGVRPSLYETAFARHPNRFPGRHRP
jgi:hypothetical protein